MRGPAVRRARRGMPSGHGAPDKHPPGGGFARPHEDAARPTVPAFERVEKVSTPKRPAPGETNESGAGDPIAERLRGLQRLLAELDIDPDARIRLHRRFLAICASLKVPGGSLDRAVRRLDRLISDVRRESHRRTGQDQ